MFGTQKQSDLKFNNFLYYLAYFAPSNKVFKKSFELKVLENLKQSTRNFILYLYNEDIDEIINSSLPETTILDHLRLLRETHEDFLNDTANSTASSTKNFTTKSIDLIKTLPFAYKSSFLEVESWEVPHLFKHHRFTLERGYKTLPTLYTMSKFETAYTDLVANRGTHSSKSTIRRELPYPNILAVIRDIISDLKTRDPNFSLQPCLTLRDIFTQLYFSDKYPDVFSEFKSTKTNPFYLLTEDTLQEVIITTEINHYKEFKPIAELDNEFHSSHIEKELLSYIKLPNNLKYTNAEIIKILATHGNLVGREFTTSTFYTADLYPETFIQTYLYYFLTNLTSSLFDKLFLFGKPKPLKGLNSISIQLMFPKYSNLFTPSQLNYFLSNTSDIQNEILRLLSITPNKDASGEQIIALEKILTVFYKMIYSYYCKLNGLDSSKPYVFTEELKSYEISPTLQSKLDSIIESMALDNENPRKRHMTLVIQPSAQILNHYVDFQYPTEFLSNLVNSGIDNSAIEEVYVGYLCTLFEKELKVVENLLKRNVKLIEICSFYETLIKSIPYHYIRLACSKTYSNLYHIHAKQKAISDIKTSMYPILALEFISALATK